MRSADWTGELRELVMVLKCEDCILPSPIPPGCPGAISDEGPEVGIPDLLCAQLPAKLYYGSPNTHVPGESLKEGTTYPDTQLMHAIGWYCRYSVGAPSITHEFPGPVVAVGTDCGMP